MHANLQKLTLLIWNFNRHGKHIQKIALLKKRFEKLSREYLQESRLKGNEKVSPWKEKEREAKILLDGLLNGDSKVVHEMAYNGCAENVSPAKIARTIGKRNKRKGI